MMKFYLKQHYAQLSNLEIVAHSSRSMMSKAIDLGFEISEVGTSSYLVLSLCFKEYCHATNLAIDRLSIEDLDLISCYYNGLIAMSPERQLMMFSGDRVKPILEEVGICIRSIVCDELSSSRSI